MSALYTHDILRLAVASGDFPLLRAPHARVDRRAPLCGSRITLEIALDSHDAVRAVGFTLTACAVGQAAAVLLAREAPGKDAAALTQAARELARWLEDAAAPIPDWPGVAALAPVRSVPARRGAALLPFQAAAEAAADAVDRRNAA